MAGSRCGGCRPLVLELRAVAALEDAEDLATACAAGALGV